MVQTSTDISDTVCGWLVVRNFFLLFTNCWSCLPCFATKFVHYVFSVSGVFSGVARSRLVPSLFEITQPLTNLVQWEAPPPSAHARTGGLVWRDKLGRVSGG